MADTTDSAVRSAHRSPTKATTAPRHDGESKRDQLGTQRLEGDVVQQRSVDGGRQCHGLHHGACRTHRTDHQRGDRRRPDRRDTGRQLGIDEA